MPVCWLATAGMVASHIITMSLPKLARLRCWPERKPSPRPTRTSSEPTPQAMPNMVRNVRTLLATMARKTWPRVSDNDCIKLRRTTAEERLVREYAECDEEVPERDEGPVNSCFV